MKRRAFLLAGSAVLFIPRWSKAQHRPPVVGLLWNDSVKPSPFAKILLRALEERGWIEGRNFHVVDAVTLEGYAGYAQGLERLLQARVDLIVTSGATATKAAASATREIPIVMRIGGDPVASGFVASLSRPGGNITGITTVQVGLNAKRIELLKELVPGLKRVGVLLPHDAASFAINVRESEAAAKALSLQIEVGKLRSLGELDALLGQLKKSGVGAVYVPGSTMLAARGEQVTAAMEAQGLPAVYASDLFADAGGLLVYSASTSKSFVRLASYVDRVLKGARPAELAVEQASDVDLVVNLRAARRLGLRIPQSILVRADRTID